MFRDRRAHVRASLPIVLLLLGLFFVARAERDVRASAAAHGGQLTWPFACLAGAREVPAELVRYMGTHNFAVSGVDPGPCPQLELACADGVLGFGLLLIAVLTGRERWRARLVALVRMRPVTASSTAFAVVLSFLLPLGESFGTSDPPWSYGQPALDAARYVICAAVGAGAVLYLLTPRAASVARERPAAPPPGPRRPETLEQWFITETAAPPSEPLDIEAIERLIGQKTVTSGTRVTRKIVAAESERVLSEETKPAGYWAELDPYFFTLRSRR